MSVEKRINRRQLLRKVAALGAGLAFAGPVLAACGPTPTPKIVEKVVEKPVEKVVKETVVVEKKVEVVKEVPAVKKVTTVTLHCRGYEHVPTAPEFPIYHVRLNEFMLENPDIKVEVQDIPTGTLADYYVKLQTMLAAATAGDITWTHQSDMDHHRLAYQGALHPLDDYMKAQAISEKEWWPAAMEVAKFEGKLYGIPMCNHPGGGAFLFYNEDMFKQKGLKLPSEETSTIDNVREWAVAFTDKAKEQYGLHTSLSGTQRQESWLREFGGEVMSPDGKKCLWNSPQALELAKFLDSLFNVSKAVPLPEAIPAGGLYAMFAAGKVGMFQSGTWGIVTSLAAVGSNFKEGMMVFPKGKAGVTGLGAYVDTYAILSGSKVKDAAFKVVRAITDQRAGYLCLSMVRSLPGREDVFLMKDFEKDSIVQMEYRAIKASPKQIACWNFRGAEFGREVQSAMDELLLGKAKPTQEFMDTVTKRAQAILDKPR